MPPKTARKSTAKRRIVRPSDLNSNGEKNDEKPREDKSQVLSKDDKTSQSKKPEVEEKSERKRDPTKETKKETIKEPEKEIIKEIKEEKPAQKRVEEIKAEEKEKEDKNEDKMEDKNEDKMDYEDEEYEPDEETTAVDYEPEENHEEYIEEEIEEADAEDYTEEEPLDDEISNHNEDENEISNHNSDQNENISDDNNSLSGEEEEQHEVVNEHRKRKEFEVFVGGLDKDATETDLRRVFSQAGEITEIRLLVNPVTKKNKGFAFLRFATVEQAKRVVREFKAPVVCGKRCGVAASHDNDTLFVGNICKTWTKEHLKETLKGYGVDNFEELKLVDDIHNEGMNRGFAFLEFSSRDEALDALKRIQKRDVNLGTDRVPKVAFSDSFKELDEEVMSHVSTVFIDHLPPAWDEDKIRKHLKNYGSIQKIELARNMPSAKRRDFGFVTFDTHDHAIACINGISGIELGEGDKIVKLKARLSRPTKKEHRPRRISMMMSSFPPIRMVRPIPPRMDRFRGSSFRGRQGAPPRRPGPPPRHFGTPPVRGTLRVAPMGRGSRVVRRVVSSGLDSRRALITVTERPPPVPIRFSNNNSNSRSRNERLPPPPPPLPPPVRRQPPGGTYKGSVKRGRGEREYNSSRHEELPPPPPGPPSRRPRNIPSYDDEDDDVYGSSGRLPPPPPYSDIAPRGMNSRASDRRAFLEHDDYGNNGSSSNNNNSSRKHHDDRGAPRGAPRNYDSVYGGSKRPYSDIDDGPRHGERNPRARLDYSSANNYSDSYNDRMGRGGYGGTGGSRNSLYGNNRQGMNYASGSGRGNDIESMYPSGLSGSYGGGGGGSYPSVYSNRGLGGGSNSYY